MTENAEWGHEYANAVEEFLEHANSWLTATERPLVIQLKALARTLDRSMLEDGAVQSAAASQFAGTWGRLAKRDPEAGKGGKGGDGLEGLLDPLPGLENGLAHGAGCRCEACA